MKSSNILKSSTAWALASQALQYGTILIVLPVGLQYMLPEEVSLWLVLLAISSGVFLMDIGLAQSLSRNIAFILAGARRLRPWGVDESRRETSVDGALLAKVLHAARTLYILLAASVFLLLSILGSLYVGSIAGNVIPIQTLVTAWITFVLGTVAGVSLRWYGTVLQGFNEYGHLYRSLAIGSLINILLSITLLLLGAGLVGLTLSYTLSLIASRLEARRCYHRLGLNIQSSWLGSNIHSFKQVVRAIWPTTWRLTAAAAGGYAIARGSIFLASFYLGLVAAAPYVLSVQVIIALQGVTMVPLLVRQSRIAALQQLNSQQEVRRLFVTSLLFSTLIFVPSAVVIALLGERLLGQLTPEATLIPPLWLTLLATAYFLEVIHASAANYFTTRNTVPFMWAAVLSGTLVVATSWIGLALFGFGIEWLIMTQVLIQLVFNNWYWPYRFVREMRKVTSHE